MFLKGVDGGGGGDLVVARGCIRYRVAAGAKISSEEMNVEEVKQRVVKVR